MLVIGPLYVPLELEELAGSPRTVTPSTFTLAGAIRYEDEDPSRCFVTYNWLLGFDGSELRNSWVGIG
jgi:hypothetical protein